MEVARDAPRVNAADFILHGRVYRERCDGAQVAARDIEVELALDGVPLARARTHPDGLYLMAFSWPEGSLAMPPNMTLRMRPLEQAEDRASQAIWRPRFARELQHVLQLDSAERTGIWSEDLWIRMPSSSQKTAIARCAAGCSEEARSIDAVRSIAYLPVLAFYGFFVWLILEWRHAGRAARASANRCVPMPATKSVVSAQDTFTQGQPSPYSDPIMAKLLHHLGNATTADNDL